MFAPMTPAGTVCTWLASPTEDQAWAALLKDAAHMPYKGKAGFQQRGYTVVSLAPKEAGSGTRGKRPNQETKR